MNCSKYFLQLYGFFFTITTLSCCLCIASSSIRSDALCFESERQALLRFKQDLIDPSNRLSSWVGNDCCRWDGIVCNNFTRHVTKIKLGNPVVFEHEYRENYEAYQQQQLGGKINPTLLDLKHLRHLDLNNNDFNSTSIPSFIGSIISLRYLNFSDSRFGGEIPHQLGNLTRLRYLDLRLDSARSGDSLQWVSGLVSLQYLDMSRSNLSKAIGWVHVTSMLPSLRELHLHDCQLRDISPSITSINFTSLSVLDLSGNKFNSTVPRWFSSLSRLVSLNIGERSFLGSPLPSVLQNMTLLRAFSNSDNYDSTERIPKWFYSLTQLEIIALSDNNLQGAIASEIENFTSLTNLNLYENRLEGAIPVSLGKLRNLREISLLSNRFDKLDIRNFLKSFVFKKLEILQLDGINLTGHLPDEIGEFTNLTHLSLCDSSISGPIPPSIGRLSNLKYLDLSYSQLNGSLPESLGHLTMLEDLYLDWNFLEGVVTDHNFAHLKSLKMLSGSRNKITWKSSDGWFPPFQLDNLFLSNWQLGPRFPSWLKSQKKLINLEMSNTGLSDFIPTRFWENMQTLRYLNLSSNGIYGEIPNDGNMNGGLLVIDLSSNNFTGSLPPFFSKAQWLDLSNNSFSGSLHRFFCNDTNKSYRTIIDFGNNLLSGRIPDCWENFIKLEVLKLDNNNLSGSISDTIGSMDSLQSLHLGNNNLSGKLPPTLRFCNRLETIDLGWNQLKGKIPIWVGKSFPKLVNLNLHFNRFYGEIPTELCYLESLQILDLAHNNFSGFVPKCFSNFRAMFDTKSNSDYGFKKVSYTGISLNIESEYGTLVIKGRESKYSSTIRFVKAMDLSSNNLSGKIPEGLIRLVGLRFLNLAQNHFSGSIPFDIGEMGLLESLDLSLNKLSGEIPLSMSRLNFLAYLNLSHNDLTGQIPSGTQLQSFNESNFAGNKLCGPPLEKCNTNIILPKVVVGDKEEGDDARYQGLWFIGSVTLGFVFGFWTVICPLVLSRSWRITYYRSLDSFWGKLSDVVLR